MPVGCVVVREGEVVGAAHNERELRGDPTAHAEVLALRAAALHLGGLAAAGHGASTSPSSRARCAPARSSRPG